MKQTPYYVVESSTNFPFPKQESGKTSPSTSKVVSASVHSGSYDQAHNILGLANRRRRQLNLLPLNEHCHSPGEQCPICDKSGVLTMQNAESFARMSFDKAALVWHTEQLPFWKGKTAKSYLDYIGRLNKFFSAITLEQVHIGHFKEYQRLMAKHYGATSVNHDLNTLSQILKKAKLWDALKEFYRPLPTPKWTPPRVLTEKEEDAFFKLAASRPDYSLAYWVGSLTNNTSASGCELRALQLMHVRLDMDPPTLYVPSEEVKNEYRARVIPLNERGCIQMQRILERAYSLGSTKPQHYLFPFRVKRNCFDPTRHASDSFIKKQWNKLVDEAIALGVITFRVRPHDMRHQILTKLLENGTPEQTVMAIAGHVSRQMLEHYSHQRVEAKARALAAINPGKKKPLQFGGSFPQKNDLGA
jgi:integrase